MFANCYISTVNVRYVIAVGIFAAATTLYSSPGNAGLENEDTMLAGAKLCTRYLPRHEREYGIPAHLLAAIASTESGRYHKGIGLTIPWPWTINAEGKGYFFDTKEEAVSYTQKLIASGVKSIDVGCMQINLHHHPEAFSNLNEAFEPRYNVAYAATFLRRNYDDLGSWKSAAAAYHSRTPEFGNRYIGRVYDAWNKILTKIAEARSGKTAVAGSQTRANFDVADAAPVSRDALTQKLKESRSGFSPKEVALSEPPRQQRKPIRMKVIELARKESRIRENGVMVIRPENEEVQIASVQAPAFQDSPIVATRSNTLKSMQPADPAMREEALGAIEPAAGGGQFSPQNAKLIRINRSGKSRVEPATVLKSPQFVFDN